MRRIVGRWVAVLAIVSGVSGAAVAAAAVPASAATPSAASHASSSHSRVQPADWWL